MNGESDMDKMYKWMDMSYKETGILTDEEDAQYSELPVILYLAFMIPIVTFALVVMFA